MSWENLFQLLLKKSLGVQRNTGKRSENVHSENENRKYQNGFRKFLQKQITVSVSLSV